MYVCRVGCGKFGGGSRLGGADETHNGQPVFDAVLGADGAVIHRLPLEGCDGAGSSHIVVYTLDNAYMFICWWEGRG